MGKAVLLKHTETRGDVKCLFSFHYLLAADHCLHHFAQFSHELLV